MEHQGLSPQQMAQASRVITSGIWSCAGIAMVTNLLNGTAVAHELLLAAGLASWMITMGTVVGLLTALAVDASLIVVITASTKMHSLGLPSRWGRVGHVTIAAFSLALNSGTSLAAGHYFLATLHAICPVLIVLLSLIGQESSMEFGRRMSRQHAAEQAVVESRRRADQERVDAQRAAALAAASEEEDRRRREAHQRTLTAEAEKAAAANQRAADEAERLRRATEQRVEAARGVLAKPHLVVDNTRNRRPAAAASVAERATSWLLEQHRAGVPLDMDDPRVGPRAIAAAAGLNPETCRKSHKRWKSEVAGNLRLIAELEEAAG